MKRIRICITGGHPTPALAVVEQMQQEHPSWDMMWIGRQYSFEEYAVPSSEYEMVRRAGISFFPNTTGRLQRVFSLYTIPSLLKIPGGFWNALQILREQKPDAVLSFGGYVAFPVCLSAALLGIPVVTHEQGFRPGLSNRMIFFIARRICVSFPETLQSIPKGKGIVTGLPIRQELFHPPAAPSFPIALHHLPMIYITGGSTGAESINNAVVPIIPELVHDMIIIHQTGYLGHDRAVQMQQTLGILGKRYITQPFFSAGDVAWIYRHARLAVGRSGANTTSELTAFGVNTVLIPLPNSAGDEQMEHARRMAAAGSAVICNQKNLSSEFLLKTIRERMSKGRNAERNSGTYAREPSRRIVAELESCLK